jgi:uncharacterized protein with PQ loop repeat
MPLHWLGYAGITLCALAYLPQIVHLIRWRCSAGLSMRAYLMWAVAAVLLLLYAITIRDTVFIVLQSYHLAAGTVICVFCKRYEGLLCEDHGG